MSKLLNYQKTSCPCGNCPGGSSSYFVQGESDRTTPSSIGVSKCQLSSGFNCFSKQIYNQDIQPQCENDKCTPLNRIGLTLEDAKYVPVKCDGSNSGCSGGWAGHNPLLIDAPRGTRLLLDRPNFSGEVAVGNVCHDEIYTPYFKDYGKGYTDYTDITGGQIQYYMSEDIAEAYFQPNFVTPARVTHEVFVDPMGVIRPQYPRQSLKPYSWDKCCKTDCDSFTHDSLEFRQELMEKQMRKRNEQRWEPRWSKYVA